MSKLNFEEGLCACFFVINYWFDHYAYIPSLSITDPYESLVVSILSNLLVDGPASPFYQALLDANIGIQAMFKELS